MKKNIAIIIPAYKATFLQDTLDSLACQECKEFTVYIGDDASPHRLEEIVRCYTEQLDIVYRFFSENLGHKDLTAHWTRCINMSQEPIIWFFSDDDVMPSDAVCRLTAALKTYGDKKVIFRFPLAIIDDRGNIIKNNPPLTVQRTSGYDFLLEKLSNRISSAACEYVFSRDVWQQTKGFVSFPVAWCSDDATWAKFADYAGGLIPLPGRPVCWRNATGENICNSTGLEKEKIEATTLFLDWCCTRYASHLKEKKFQKALLTYVKTILKYSIKNHYSLHDLWKFYHRIGKHNRLVALRIILRHIWKVKRSPRNN